MGQAQQLLDQWKPQAYVQLDISVKYNGAEVNSASRVQLYSQFGYEPNSLAADIFDLFYVEDDGAGNVTTTEITLTGLCDVMPLRWEWNYDEEDTTSPGTYYNQTETWDFDGASASRTFSPSAANRKCVKGFQAFTITAFKCPN